MHSEVYKAYSLLTEKSFDQDDAVIRGYATTPTPDRVRDIVVPGGVVFRTSDIKLHLYHDHRLPVGQVRFGKPTTKGLPFEATLPDVTEDGVIRDRVNEARHSIKYNLISAVSIGFRPLEGGVEVMDNGGLKFTRWEMVELSLTSVPANPEAVFVAAKSMRAGDRIPNEILRHLKLAKGEWVERGIPLVYPVDIGNDKLKRRPDGAVKLIASS